MIPLLPPVNLLMGIVGVMVVPLVMMIGVWEAILVLAAEQKMLLILLPRQFKNPPQWR